ncbi:hypothetical protein CAOG_08885, partial [Capsaspora owczarzaki ATCC 30864]
NGLVAAPTAPSTTTTAVGSAASGAGMGIHNNPAVMPPRTVPMVNSFGEAAPAGGDHWPKTPFMGSSDASVTTSSISSTSSSSHRRDRLGRDRERDHHSSRDHHHHARERDHSSSGKRHHHHSSRRHSHHRSSRRQSDDSDSAGSDEDGSYARGGLRRARNHSSDSGSSSAEDSDDTDAEDDSRRHTTAVTRANARHALAEGFLLDDVTCGQCGKIFRRPDRLSAHVRTHATMRPFVCTMADCSKTFREKAALKKHMISHGDIRPYTCERCGAGFKFNHHLKRHDTRCLHRLNRICGSKAPPTVQQRALEMLSQAGFRAVAGTDSVNLVMFNPESMATTKPEEAMSGTAPSVSSPEHEHNMSASDDASEASSNQHSASSLSATFDLPTSWKPEDSGAADAHSRYSLVPVAPSATPVA